MPYGEPDPQDPQIRVGVEVPAGDEAAREIAYAFSEEFAMMGKSKAWILEMFRNPFYAGAHMAYRELGADAVADIVTETTGLWGHVRIVDRDRPAPASTPASTPRWEV